MCGRFSFVTSPEKIRAELGGIETGQNLKWNFNVAPTQQAYVITNEYPGRLDYFAWGLIPHWSKETENAGKLINARMEGISSKPSFRVSLRRRRCLVLADSFYEWRNEGGKKTPYRILLKDGRLLVMAGIWDVWHKGDYANRTFCIITTPPNQEMAAVHNRMPLILANKSEQERWLSDLELPDVMEMLKTPADGLLDIYRVSDRVNSVKNNSPELHQKVNDELRLF